MGRYTGILGLLTMLGLAYIFSTNRRAIRVKTVAWGLGLQILFAVFVLRSDYGRRIFQIAGDAANRVLSYAFVGSEFVFGPLGKQGSSIGFIFAFQVLPTVIFICALFAILYHYGIMQFVIRIAAWAMTRIMAPAAPESPNVAAGHFHGPDGSAGYDSPVPARSHTLRTDDRDDQWYGARFPVRSWRPTSRLAQNLGTCSAPSS